MTGRYNKWAAPAVKQKRRRAMHNGRCADNSMFAAPEQPSNVRGAIIMHPPAKVALSDELLFIIAESI